MRFAFFAVGAAAMCMLYDDLENNCTLANNCTVIPGQCRRTDPCDAACSNPECGNGTAVTNYTSCSTCADTCGRHQTNATCSATAVCEWAPASCTDINTPDLTECQGKTTASSCLSELCVWIELSETKCGAASPSAFCSPCNDTANAVFDNHVLSSLHGKVGQTCTWPKIGGFASDYVISIRNVTQNPSCPALHHHEESLDDDHLAEAAEHLGAVLPPSNISCVNTSTTPTPDAYSSANALFPSLCLALAAAALF